ncbi:hypothetical protein NMD88_04060 [Edwardsiella tarda]
MTPREIALLVAAKLEHEGHQLNEADRREIRRSVDSGEKQARRFQQMMASPTYQWKKSTRLRRGA